MSTHSPFGTRENLPELPLTWKPDDRLSDNLDFSDIVMRDERYDNGGRQSLLDFCENAMHRYIIPDHVATMLDATLLGLPKGEIGTFRNLLQTVQSEEHEDQMLHRFESKHLRLQPVESTTGLRYYASPTGFAGGNYPIDAIAKTVGVQAEAITSDLQDDQQAIRRLMIRSGMFLFTVIKNRHSKDLVTVPEVYELTEIGRCGSRRCWKRGPTGPG